MSSHGVLLTYQHLLSVASCGPTLLSRSLSIPYPHILQLQEELEALLAEVREKELRGEGITIN